MKKLSKVEDRDRFLIAGDFLEDNIQKDKLWLTKYFKTKNQIRFLMYYFIFGNFYYFTRHTGTVLTYRYLKMLKRKYVKLMTAHKNAKMQFDLDLVQKIEDGNYE